MSNVAQARQELGEAINKFKEEFGDVLPEGSLEEFSRLNEAEEEDLEGCVIANNYEYGSIAAENCSSL